MTDDRNIVRAYSQDRQAYRHPTMAMLKRKTSMELYRQSADYYSNRNCPEILSLFALQQKHLEEQEKRIYQSLSSDEHYFNMINYPLESSNSSPYTSLSLESSKYNNQQAAFPKLIPGQSRNSTSSSEENQQATFPQVTPSHTSKSASSTEENRRTTPSKIASYLPNRFPTLTPQNNFNVSNKTGVSTYRTTMKSMPSSTNRYTPSNRNTQLNQHTRRT